MIGWLGATALESWRAMLAARAASALIACIGAAVAAAIVATTGQVAATEQQVQQRFADASSRALTIASSDPALFTPALLTDIAALSGVDAVTGLTPLGDARNTVLGPASPPVAAWQITGELPGTLADRTVLDDGEAVATTDGLGRLGMADAAGTVQLETGKAVAVIGAVDVDPAVRRLDPGVLLRVDTPERISQLTVLAADTATAAQLTQPVLALIDAPDPQQLTVTTPAALAELEAIVGADLAASGRLQLIGTLAVGALIIAAAVLGQVNLRRRDLGRRRALGASRTQLVGLVVGQTLWATLIGATAGATTTALGVARAAGTPVPATFTVSIITLTILTAALAAALPSLIASRRDPLAVLRTP